MQGAAEITYDMVSPGPSVQQKRRHSSKKKKRYTQPGDIREGMTNAYHVVKEVSELDSRFDILKLLVNFWVNNLGVLYYLGFGGYGTYNCSRCK